VAGAEMALIEMITRSDLSTSQMLRASADFVDVLRFQAAATLPKEKGSVGKPARQGSVARPARPG
jgi:hypothetical protein